MELDLLLVPWDSGHREARMGRGPERLQAALLPALEALGVTPAVQRVESGADLPTEIATAFELAESLALVVEQSSRAGRLPVVLAGNCFSAVGTVEGLGTADTAVVWLDAHGDLHTPETTRSGFLDGMALATVMGHCWRALREGLPGTGPVPPSRVLLVGARDLDGAEEEALAAWGVHHLRVAALRAGGVRETVAAAVAALEPRPTRAYVHVDLDVLDPGEGRANALAVPGGLTTEEVVAVVEGTAAHLVPAALGFTAYDPAADPDGRVPRAAARILEGFVGAVAGRRARA